MPTNTVFLDTNGWLALLNATDSLHANADRVWQKLGKQDYAVVLTDWIVAEAGNSLARTAARGQFAKEVETLKNSPQVRLIFVTSDLLDRATALYANRGDKSWGLVDCASFLVMTDEGMHEAFTNDRHFKQAGFSCLL